MHESSMLRMQWFLRQYDGRLPERGVKVLDVGSYDLNGSYRPLFDAARFDYAGLDMAPGPNVDIVPSNPYDWQEIQTDSYDVVVSGQAFEHIEFFWVTMTEMARVLKQDGLLCLIAPNGFGEHRHPVDCYRFLSDGMTALARYVELEPLHVHTNCAPSRDDTAWYGSDGGDAMLVATKPYQGPARHPDLKTYQCTPAQQESLRAGLVPYTPPSWTQRLWRRLSGHRSS